MQGYGGFDTGRDDGLNTAYFSVEDHNVRGDMRASGTWRSVQPSGYFTAFPQHDADARPAVPQPPVLRPTGPRPTTGAVRKPAPQPAATPPGQPAWFTGLTAGYGVLVFGIAAIVMVFVVIMFSR
jgi:hypothetical protein